MMRSSKKADGNTAPERFLSIYQQGLVRVAACRPRSELTDPQFNLAQTLDLARKGHEQAVGLMVFPELER